MTKEYNKVEDSGSKQKWETGAQRDTQTGKGRYDLLPPKAIHRVAKHFENGAIKYNDRNWENGIPLSRYIDSATRHIFKVIQGLDDEDHEAAAVWNMLCFMETKERIEKSILPKELDDMPYTYTQLKGGKRYEWKKMDRCRS